MSEDNITPPPPETFAAFRAALEEMPDELRVLELDYFIAKLLEAYRIKPDARLAIAMSIIQRTDGASVGVVAVRPDLSLEDLAGMRGTKH